MSEIKIILKNEKRTDGKQVLYLRSPFFADTGYIKLNLKFIADHNTSIAIHREDFDSDAEKVLKSEPQFIFYNALISKAKGRANEIIFKYQALNKKITKNIFKNEFIFGTPASDDSFIDFVEKKIKERRYDTKSNLKLTDSSLKQHFAFLSILKRFRNDLKFSHLNEDLIFEFKQFLQNSKNKYKRKYKKSSINNLIRKFKQYVSQAFREGFIVQNPLINLKLMEKEDIKIIALNSNEIKDIISVYYSNEITNCQKDVLKQYLFSCFTGLRLSDIKQLKKNNLEDNQLKFTAKKNKKQIEIPLSKFAIEIIENNFYKEPGDYLFVNHGHNKYYNFPLRKIIAQFTEIDKPITFHTGRKTFATNYLNQNPEDYVTLSDYLGDTLEQTLKTYAKIVTKTKEQRIKFLDDFIPEAKQL